ncbi:hypothetical protein DSO57_1005053 [Entomophthora muscae]|uniref:Uncharacterized protein n=1 Tax=Entomophthora muscae TaxID=34485 RepID=A0ACC2USY9_9FUNG|nr:hypothetical protein DSO57_1005053 [Entomophthora muscae]
MSSRGYVYDQWRIDLEDLHHTPSIKDGKTYEEERIARSKGCMFITSLGNSLRVTQIVIASASVFFHRFFLRNSFKDHHFYDVGAACLFLATKTEECGRHLDDIVRDVMKHCSKTENFKVEKDSKEFKTWKRIIIFYEELVLEAVCFDLEIDHPYKQMIKFSESLGCSDKLSRSAWAFLNDSFRTTLCLTHDNEVVAAAAIFIASKYLDEPLPHSEALWRKLVGSYVC